MSKVFSEGANANVQDKEPYNLNDMANNKNYDDSVETLKDDVTNVGLFDMRIPNEACYSNNFEGYGENGCAAIQNTSKYILIDFSFKEHHLQLITCRFLGLRSRKVWTDKKKGSSNSWTAIHPLQKY